MLSDLYHTTGRAKKPRMYIPSDDEDDDSKVDGDDSSPAVKAFTQRLTKFKKSPIKKKKSRSMFCPSLRST